METLCEILAWTVLNVNGAACYAALFSCWDEENGHHNQEC